MILTIFRPDGSMERRAIGYAGGACDVATAPYEKYDMPGVTRTPTHEANLSAAEAATTAEKATTRG
jgi:hypothetical protein